MIVKAGSTDVSTYFVLRLAPDGTEATGLTITNFDLQYTRSGVAPAAKVDATALAATDSAHGDNQAIEIDATDQPGLYRVDWPDAAFAAGVREVILTVKCATCFAEHLRVEIVGYDPADGVRLGLTALPNAAADAAGGLPISDAGGLDLDDQIGTKINDILTDTGTTLQGELDGIQADTEDIQSRLPAALTGGGNIKADVLAVSGDTTAADTLELFAEALNQVTGQLDAGSLTDDTITAASIATGALTADAFAANAIVAATLAADCITAAKVAADVWHELIELAFTYDATATYATANAGSLVVQIADNAGGSELTVEAIADEVQTRTIAAVTLVATTTNLTNLPAITANWLTAAGIAADAVAEIQSGLATAANLATVAGYLDTEIAAILADTNELQTDWVNGGRLDLILDAIAVDVAGLDGAAMRGTDGAALASVCTEARLSELDAANLPADIAAVKTDTAAILLDTGTDGVIVAAASKTGYALSATGLNLVIPADPSAIPVLGTATITQWSAWFAAWSVNEVNSTSTEVVLKNSAGTVDLATHAISDDGTTFQSEEPA